MMPRSDFFRFYLKKKLFPILLEYRFCASKHQHQRNVSCKCHCKNIPQILHNLKSFVISVYIARFANAIECEKKSGIFIISLNNTKNNNKQHNKREITGRYKNCM